MSRIKRQGNYQRKWNTESVKQFIEDNNIEIELLSEYVDMYEKMLFRCKCGELFETNWHEFNNKNFPKRQCNKCGRKKPNNKDKITCEHIKEYLKENDYTCELISTEYINCDSKLEFECECGNHFFASWSNIKKMSGLCKKCVNNKRLFYKNDDSISKNNKKIHVITFDDIQNKMNEIYEYNEYSLLGVNHSCLDIKHNVCGNIFTIRKDHFFRGQGCKFCNVQNRDFGALQNEEFLQRVSEYNDNYEFITEYRNNHTPITIRCKKCGNIFTQTPCHIFERGIYCNSCNGTKGEQYIEKYLKINDIDYILQHRFNDCKSKRLLPFDFYLPDYNVCIEYQGEQHFHPIGIFGREDSFIKQVERDNIKRKYCKNNNITLIEIYYKDFNNINNILDSFFDKVVM